jgi:uncharacterized protein YbcC (UPF0753/DUF2309 family)
LLPAQGPISIFVHHNTLHAYEYLPFESAVTEAGALFECEPFLTEAEYRHELATGRIRDEDLRSTLADDLGERRDESIASLISRFDFQLGFLRHQVREGGGAPLSWMLAETDALRGHGSLWQACVATTAHLAEAPARSARVALRHRDLLLAVTGADLDALVHPVLIRWCAAFLDQGIAPWPMPDREGGFYHAVRGLYGRPSRALEPWLRGLTSELGRLDRDGASATDVVLESLSLLGVTEPEWEPFLAATVLALRGWAGMMHQVEVRPDRVPVHAPPARLVDFVAVRLLLERSELAHLAGETLGWTGDLAALRRALAGRLPLPVPRTAVERAWLLFEMARMHAWDADRIASLSAEDVAALLAERDRLDDHERRRLLHLAYERRHRDATLDALAAHAGKPRPPAPRLQLVHCIDEREESLRRHLEEVEPACETFGTAGFFGVAMYYRGLGDAHPTPLCPIAVRPAHDVEEVARDEAHDRHRRSRQLRRWLGLAAQQSQRASRTLTQGALITFAFGLLAAVPLVFRVLSPRWTARVRRRAGRILHAEPGTRLLLERGAHPAALGRHAGFTVTEMADIVRGVLVAIGLTDRFAPLVVMVGHGSSSLNNPHESAHDCGACGGGRGGPNARAFAQMANDARVRAHLEAAGIGVPASTHFLGAFHNSCDDAVEIYDAELVPARHAEAVEHLRTVLEEARTRTAHERCRRFDAVPLSLTPREALAHVEARCEDLAQPRPEYGHATNALCIVGRRARTSGLFLDRRAFLVSYDPDADDASGATLAGVLAGVVPVVAGINLEYYFSRVDPVGYGCATKLPHNVTALLGVMDGHASDLRTGLPWQMVEIHEPMRLLIVVEATPDRLRLLMAANSDLALLLQNRWIQMAAWVPGTGEIVVLARRGPRTHRPSGLPLPRVASSREWYAGQRGFLAYARIEA